jgi:hypothetical protein
VKTATELAAADRAVQEDKEQGRTSKWQHREWAYQERLRRSTKLANTIDNPEILLLACRMYCSLPAGELVSDVPIIALLATQSRKVRAHAQVARRVLLVQVRPGAVKLPKNWRDRLGPIGLELGRPEELARFLALPNDLTLTSAVHAYAAAHPGVLERAKRFLRGERQPKPVSNRWIKPKREPMKYKSLSEALKHPKPNDDDDFYFYGDADDCEPSESDEPAFNRAASLKARIAAFLSAKDLKG